MAEGFVNVTEGSGKKLRTFNRTIGANSTEEQYVNLGDYPIASYTAVAVAISGATAASHMMQIMAGAALNVRIKRIRITQVAAAGAVAGFSLSLFRLTTAGTGGTAITPGKMDNGDAAAGATAMTLPTVKGTETTSLWQETLYAATAAIPGTYNQFKWEAMPNSKPIIIPAGTANGLAIKNTALATATWDIVIEFTETSYV